MSDGPFKNLKLNKRWKRFAEAAQNDASDHNECCGLASDAIVREILNDSNKAMLAEAQSYAKQAQLELDPLSSIENVFSNYSKTPFADTLLKEMVFRMADQAVPYDALRQAMDAAVRDHIREVRSRIQEECIRAYEAGQMGQNQFYRIVNQVSAILDSLPMAKVCEALLTGDRDAFKSAASMKIGLDEGPPL